MTNLTTLTLGLALSLSLLGCPKKADPAAGSGSGSAAVVPVAEPGSGSAPAGSGSAPVPAAGSGETMTGSSAGSAGSGSAAAGIDAPAARPATVTEAMVTEVDKAIVAIDKLGTELGASGADCKKAAAAVTATDAAMKDVVAQLDKWEALTKTDKAVAEYWMKTYDPKLKAGADKGKGTYMGCAKDKAFEAATKDNALVKYLNSKM